MLAHERAGRRERVVLTDHLHRLGKAPLLGQRDIGRHVHVGRTQRDAGHRLARARGAGARFHVAGELVGKGVEPLQHHLTSLPAHRAVGCVALQRGLGANLANRRLGGAELGHIAQQRRDLRHALSARRALAARLRHARLQLTQHHPHRALPRRHGFDAAGKRLDEFSHLPVGFRRRLYR